MIAASKNKVSKEKKNNALLIIAGIGFGVNYYFWRFGYQLIMR